MSDVLRPRLGGEGEGEGLDGCLETFAGANWTTGGRALAVVGEIGASSKLSLTSWELFAGKNTADDDELARDSNAAILACTVAEDIKAAEKGGLAALFCTTMSGSTTDLYAVAGMRRHRRPFCR